MSSKDMTLTQLKHTSKAFDDTHTISVKGFKDGRGGRKPGSKNKMTLAELAKIVQEGFAKQEQFNQSMMQFKDYVLDVFKRNNLK